MKYMKYFISQNFLEPPLEVEIEPPPPCLFCGTPVMRPSMNGPLVCGPCDMGRNADGSRWTNEQRKACNAHLRDEMNKYRAMQVPPREPLPDRPDPDWPDPAIVIGNKTTFCPDPNWEPKKSDK